MYSDENGGNRLMEVEDWKQFGGDLCHAIGLIAKISNMHKIKTFKEFSRVLEN